MANPASEVDFTIPLATKLAAAVSDGTWADVFNVLKVDKVGKLVPASSITTAAGQLLSNLIDDVIQKVWTLLEGRENYDALSTVGAVTDDVVIASLADGDAIAISAKFTGHGAANNEVCTETVIADYYRDGAVVELQKVGTLSDDDNLAGFAVDLVISGTDIKAEVTGVAAKTISWTAWVDHVRRRRA